MIAGFHLHIPNVATILAVFLLMTLPHFKTLITTSQLICSISFIFQCLIKVTGNIWTFNSIMLSLLFFNNFIGFLIKVNDNFLPHDSTLFPNFELQNWLPEFNRNFRLCKNFSTITSECHLHIHNIAFILSVFLLMTLMHSKLWFSYLDSSLH